MTSPRPARNLPRRITYPLAGLAIGLGAPLSYLLLWNTLTHPDGTLVVAIEELGARAGTWVALTLPGIFALVVFGWIFGRREDSLIAQSVTDSLTELPNLAGHRARLTDELARASRLGTPVSLLLVDVDRLKQINDQNGHAAGDEAIQLVAESLRRSCRAIDHAARIGGDEFAVLVPGARARDAFALAQRIRMSLDSLRGGPGAPTVSIGIADLASIRTLDPVAFRAAADQALYRAKAEGRDRVVGSVPSTARNGRPIGELVLLG